MDSSAYKSSFKRRRMHSRSCSNLEFIQRWQAATFFYSNIPLQMLHNSLIFFHFPVQKWILNWIWGFGNEPEQKSQRCWVIVIPASEWYLSERERENILPTALSFLSGKDEKSESNIFKIMWITPLIHKGARLLKVALIRVSANKQKFSRFRFSKAIWELRCRRYCKQTENYSTASWKDWMFLSHIYIPKVPNIPAGQRESWLWLLPRKWERHNRYTRMHCGNKRRDFLFRLW